MPKLGGLKEAIISLKAEQLALRTQKALVSKTLRNHTKRASRLKKRAKALTDKDLLELLRMRGSTHAIAADEGEDEQSPDSMKT